MAVTINGSGQLPVRIVSTTKTDVFTTTSGSFVDVTGLSVTITPTSASNRILVFCSTAFCNLNGDSTIRINSSVGLLPVGTSGTVVNGISSASGSDTNSMFNPSMCFLHSPATTSAVTYTVQVVSNGGTTFINRRGSNDAFSGISTITVMEISG
jgi:hypothetical protein